MKRKKTKNMQRHFTVKKIQITLDIYEKMLNLNYETRNAI